MVLAETLMGVDVDVDAPVVDNVGACGRHGRRL